MAHCININHPEYKKLVPQFKGPEALLKAKISLWQENNELDNFPTIDQLEERKNILYDKMSIEDKIQKELTIEQNKKVSENVLKVVADKLTKRTNIPYNIVNYEDIKDKYEDVESTTKGFYAPGEKAIYFIRGNFTLETAFHEFAHPIVDTILTKNRILFRDLSLELQSDKYKDSFAEVIKKYAFDYKFDTTVTQEQLNDYNVEDTFKFFNTLPRYIRIKLLSEGITNAWGQESETWIDKTTGKIKVNLAEVNPLVRLWQMIVDWFKEFIDTGKVEDIKPTTTIRELGQMLALGDNDIQIEDIDRDAIKYTLKSIDILDSDKAKQIFEKGNKNNWSIDKILQELAIPKEQKELVKQSYLDGNKTPDDIAIDIASKYSFVVKSEVAKDKIGRPTQHHSNLSARNSQNVSKYKEEDGWKYQEIAIQTPAIINISSAHTKDFSGGVSNMIGWIRLWYNKNTGVVEIQEIQSDLFQKGRNVGKLDKFTDEVEWNGDFLNQGEEMGIENMPTPEEIERRREVVDKQFDTKENQFLQLLNKDNNWVTFFIKAITQYYAKQQRTVISEQDIDIKIKELEQNNELEIDCSKVKAKDGIRSKFTKGSQWEVVKDLKGYPSHAQGGVDVKIGKNGFSFTRNNSIIEAKHGLVLPKIN